MKQNNKIRKVVFDITLTKTQLTAYDEIHKPDTTYLVLRWSRLCGKSIFCELLLIEYLLKPNTFNIYLSPTYSIGTKVFNDIHNILLPTGLIKKANALTLRIETISGAVFLCYSMQNPNAIRGNTVNGILVMDECAYMPTETVDGQHVFYSVVYPLLKAHIKTNKVIIVSTPKGKANMFYEFYCKALAGEKGWKEISATIYEDGLVTQELIDEIKNTISPIAWKEEFLVEFLDSGSSFFYGFEKCFTNFLYDDKAKQWIGIDLSANGKDDTIVTKINDKKQVKQYTITGSLDLKYRKIADIINSTKNLKSVYVEVNGIGAPIYNQLSKLVNNKQILKEWLTTNKTKLEILGLLAADIANMELLFDAEDKQLYSLFGTFVVKYTKHGTMLLQAAGTFKDDKIMSLAIALKAKNSAAIGNYTFNF